MTTCKDCRFFRIKSDRFGVCESPDAAEQVHVFGEPAIRRTLQNLGFSQIGQDSVLSELDIRVREDFGCRHFQKREETT